MSPTRPWLTPLLDELRRESFTVTHVEHLAPAGGADPAGTADLVVVDVDAPGGSGIRCCGALREASSVAVVAMGRADEHLLHALEAGADIFVDGASSPREQLARIRALLRRLPERTDRPSSDVLQHGSVTIDLRERRAEVRGVAVELSEHELDVLTLLLLEPGRVVTREAMVQSARGRLRDARSLDSIVRRLRDKLGSVDGRADIRAVRSVGFVFADDPVDKAPGPGGSALVAQS